MVYCSYVIFCSIPIFSWLLNAILKILKYQNTKYLGIDLKNHLCCPIRAKDIDRNNGG